MVVAISSRLQSTSDNITPRRPEMRTQMQTPAHAYTHTHTTLLIVWAYFGRPHAHMDLREGQLLVMEEACRLSSLPDMRL